MTDNSFRVVISALLSLFMIFAGANPYVSAASNTTGTESNCFSPASGQNSAAMQEEMLNYINAARAEAGLSPLILDARLTNGACLKNLDMINNAYFSHISPSYGSPVDMMNCLGIAHNGMGENLAKNFTVQGAFNAFMNSPHHRANLLNAEFTSAGFAFHQANDYLYVTEWFTG